MINIVSIVIFIFCHKIRASTATMSSRCVVWLRNNLRVHDNILLHAAANIQPRPTELICVYCFDPRIVGYSPWGSKKTSALRSNFVIESVSDLRSNLRSIGGDLLVSQGYPEEIISKLMSENNFNTLIYHDEVTSEEIEVQKNVEKALESFRSLRIMKLKDWSLYDVTDLPFSRDLRDFPDQFTAFKNIVESRCKVRQMFPAVTATTLPPTNHSNINQTQSDTCSFTYMPTLSSLGYSEEEQVQVINKDARSAFPFRGGESAGMERLTDWIFAKDHLKEYFDIRNGLIGTDYSSKMSPWLALGCVSPRYSTFIYMLQNLYIYI